MLENCTCINLFVHNNDHQHEYLNKNISSLCISKFTFYKACSSISLNRDPYEEIVSTYVKTLFIYTYNKIPQCSKDLVLDSTHQELPSQSHKKHATNHHSNIQDVFFCLVKAVVQMVDYASSFWNTMVNEHPLLLNAQCSKSTFSEHKNLVVHQFPMEMAYQLSSVGYHVRWWKNPCP